MFRTGFVGRQFPSGLGAGSASGANPSLDLNLLGPTLDPRITFTRAGATATYFDSTGTLQTAAANAPRFDYDPNSKQARGLLIEESRINQCWPSIPDASANWPVNNATNTPNSTTAPDGTNTGTLIVDNATISQHSTQTLGTLAFVSGTTYSFSVFAKAATAWGLQIFLGGAAFTSSPYADFRLDTGVAGSVAGTGATSAIQPIGNGWYRCSLSVPADASASTVFIALALTNNNNAATRAPNYGGSGTGVYIWGAQTEAGAFPTSYIPTTAAAVTRNSDAATMPLTGWFNPAVGTFDDEFIMSQTPVAGTQAGHLRVDDGSGTNLITLFTSNTSQIFVFGSSGGVQQINSSVGGPILGAINRASITYGPVWSGQANAGAVVSNAGTPPVGLNRLILSGSSANLAIWQLNGWQRRIRYWPRQLSAGEQLQVNSDSTLDIGFIDPVGGLDPRITLTRAGATATYIDINKRIQVAAANTARFDHDVGTGTPLGLLVEEARSNMLNSSDTNMNPGQAGTTFVSSDLPPLKAGATIWRHTWPNGGSNGVNQTNIAVSSSTTYALTMYVWLPTAYDPTIDSPPRIDFDIGTLGSGGSTTKQTADITKRNQWQRITTISVLGTGASAVANFVIRRDTTGPLQGGQTIYVTCPQMEAGAFPTSYIPSTGSPPTTRNADFVTLPTGPWYNSALCSVAVEHRVMAWNSSGNRNCGLFSLDDGASNRNNCIDVMNFTNSGTFQQPNFSIRSGGSSTGSIAYTNINVGGPGFLSKTAAAWSATAASLAANGGAAQTTVVTGLPPGVNRLVIGDGFAGIGFFGGYISRVRCWPRKISDTELQAATI